MEIFQSTTAVGLYEIYLLNILPNDEEFNNVFIPEDVFAYHWVTEEIEIGHCSSCDGKRFLKIDPNAFRSSKNFTLSFLINDFDLKNLNFNFLENFIGLEYLGFHNCTNVHLIDLPVLPNLFILSLNSCTGLNDWVFPTPIANHFQKITFSNNAIDDEQIEQILNSFSAGPSEDNLISLDLSYNALTKIPTSLKLFQSLEEIFLHHQEKPGFGVLLIFLSLRAPLSMGLHFLNVLDLSSSHITRITSNTFLGMI